MKEPSLFDQPAPNASYPNAPGWKQSRASRKAASEMRSKAPTIRQRVYALFQQHIDGLTADECAEMLGLEPDAVRPRVSELKNAGLLERTEALRRSMREKSAHVYRIL
ncbi:MAG: hypothetical protein AAF432_00600 [Planctomycetota bacterium]